MIVSRTPLRVSFVGGGTDLPAFYERHGYGCVISAAINKYVYVAVNHRFDGLIRLAYSSNEVVSSTEEIQNDRIRAALDRLGIRNSIEIFYISDVPKKMGLGGSSSFTVGLLHALYRHIGVEAFPERLAREACEIEIKTLGNPIGKQDQYAAALGGLNYIKFWGNGTVSVKPILVDESLILSLMQNLLFIYLGVSHNSASILADVNGQMARADGYLLRMRDLTDELYRKLMNRNVDEFVCALRENWELKKMTSSRVANSEIDELYKEALRCGAEAGKVLGAGGGGFLMVYVPQDRQDRFLKEMTRTGLKILRFGIDHRGTQIVHSD